MTMLTITEPIKQGCQTVKPRNQTVKPHNQSAAANCRLSCLKMILILAFLAMGVNTAAAQYKAIGKLNSWTLSKVSSREKDEEILPVSYKMRVSKNKDFDRVVFEFSENEVPEYSVQYAKPPILIDANHLENSLKPNKNEIISVKGKAFVMITFALGFEGKNVGAQFFGQQNLPILRDLETVDWFENFFSFAVGLNEKKPFRVAELSNPTRLVIDFQH